MERRVKDLQSPVATDQQPLALRLAAGEDVSNLLQYGRLKACARGGHLALALRVQQEPAALWLFLRSQGDSGGVWGFEGCANLSALVSHSVEAFHDRYWASLPWWQRFHFVVASQPLTLSDQIYPHHI